MRMRDIFPGLGRMRLLGDDAISGLLAGAIPVEPDFKRSQIDVFQRDRLGGHAEPAAAEVVVHLVELFLQSQQISVDVARFGQCFSDRHPGQLGDDSGQLGLHRGNRVAEVRSQLMGGQVPAPQLGPADLAHQIDAQLPGDDRAIR